MRPDQEMELHRYFSGALAAAMGIRSTMGGQIAVLKLGCRADPDKHTDTDEQTLEASWEYGRIDSVLRCLSDADRRVLRLYYEPLSLGETEGLEIFGQTVRLALVLFGGDRSRLLATVKRAKRGHHGAKQEAAAVVYGLVFQSATRARRAQEAYAAVAEHRKRPRRPWYVHAKAGQSA